MIDAMFRDLFIFPRIVVKVLHMLFDAIFVFGKSFPEINSILSDFIVGVCPTGIGG